MSDGVNQRVMYLIVGLGNPGEKYATTFHNVGFMALEILAQKLNLRFKTKQCRAETAECFRKGEKVILARPQTFMNLSGESVRELMGKFRVPPENLLVVYDDLDLNPGALRLRPNGSSGTHNGMRSIVACLGTSEFKRIRVGIGRPPVPEFPIADYVLSEVPKKDRELIFQTLTDAADAALAFADGEAFDRIMQRYNRK